MEVGLVSGGVRVHFHRAKFKAKELFAEKPTRACLNKIGPGEVIFIKTEMTKPIGAITAALTEYTISSGAFPKRKRGEDNAVAFSAIILSERSSWRQKGSHDAGYASL